MSSILTHTTADKCEDYREDGWYPTPWEGTEAFMLAERPWLKDYDRVDEPACGDGAMAEVIREHGITVMPTDLVYRGYGYGGIDFLAQNFERSARCLLTNPPFSDEDGNALAEGFIRQAHRLGYEYIGMILKANYFNTKNRVPLFMEHRPVRIRPFSWRLDFTGGGNNHFDCIYVAWQPLIKNDFCIFCEPLEKPKVRSQLSLF